MQISVITPVATEPVSLADAKLHLRLTAGTFSGDTTEDALITNFITVSREYCENFTGRGLASQTLEAFGDEFPSSNMVELPSPPLQSVTSVKYTDSDGTETTMTPTTDYIVDTSSNIGRIVLPYGKSWPLFIPYSVNPIKIRYVAGYTTAPKAIKQAMLLLIGHWYANREATGEAMGQIEFAVKALLSQYKVRWFG